MRVVYKYELNTFGSLTKIDVPLGSRVLSAQQQGYGVVVWIEQRDTELSALCPDFSMKVVVRLVMTGQPTDDALKDWTFLDTVQIGAFVIHVYYQNVGDVDD